jgi:acyl-CoA thioester hydrolase
MKETFRVWQPIEVRWGDMDAFGHVNNARYFTYCESARILYFETLEFDRYRATEKHGPAVVTATCNFHRQVHYPKALEVGARAIKIGGKSFTLEYAVYHAGSNELVADGSSVVAWVDYGIGQAVPLPAALKQRIREFDALP